MMSQCRRNMRSSDDQTHEKTVGVKEWEIEVDLRLSREFRLVGLGIWHDGVMVEWMTKEKWGMSGTWKISGRGQPCHSVVLDRRQN